MFFCINIVQSFPVADILFQKPHPSKFTSLLFPLKFLCKTFFVNKPANIHLSNYFLWQNVDKR